MSETKEIKIEWELEPILNEVEDGRLKKRIWQTVCQKLRLTQVQQRDTLKVTADIETSDGYKQCERNPMGVGYVLYYNTIREAAEAAERVLSAQNPQAKVTTNREDMLTVAMNYTGSEHKGTVAAQSTTGSSKARKSKKFKKVEEEVSVVANEVFPIKESKARKLLEALGLPGAAKGTVDRIQTKLNGLSEWAGKPGRKDPEDAEQLNLFRAISNAIEDGEEIKVVPDTQESAEDNESAESTVNETPVDDPDKQIKAIRSEPIWKIESEQLVALTPKLIKEFQELELFPRDRGLKDSILRNLEEAFAKMEFRGSELASVYVKEVNKTFRVNGKHTCEVATRWLAADKELPKVKMTVKRYSCDTMEQAADLYQTFDPSFSARSKGDIIKCYASAASELENVKDAVLKLVTPAMAYAEWGANYKKVSTEDQTHFMLENSGFVAWLVGIMDQKKDAPHLWRSPIVTAMFRTWLVDAEEAKDFWESVKHMDDDPDSDPQKLRTWLTKATFGASQKPGRVTNREAIYHCQHAWNAYRGKEDSVYPPKKYKDDAEVPECV